MISDSDFPENFIFSLIYDFSLVDSLDLYKSMLREYSISRLS